MIRRNIVMALVAALLGVIVFAPGAVAQGEEESDEPHGDIIASQTCAYNNTCPKGPNTRVPDSQGYDPGDVGAAFANSEGPSADVIPQIQPTPVPAADAGGAADVQAPQLAFTGAETDVLTWVGSGMIAAGALALVARRRLTD